MPNTRIKHGNVPLSADYNKFSLLVRWVCANTIYVTILEIGSAVNLEKFVITGGRRLEGEVTISGAKNAAVAILPAVILSDEVCRIENIPGISDVAVIVRILYELGAGVKVINKSTLKIDPRHIDSHIVPADLTKRMRASSYFMGAMLGRFSKARIAPPGGCDFGVRPIDQHIKGFEALGAKVVIDGGMAM